MTVSALTEAAISSPRRQGLVAAIPGRTIALEDAGDEARRIEYVLSPPRCRQWTSMVLDSYDKGVSTTLWPETPFTHAP
jgi:hypothetical protein